MWRVFFAISCDFNPRMANPSDSLSPPYSRTIITHRFRTLKPGSIVARVTNSNSAGATWRESGAEPDATTGAEGFFVEALAGAPPPREAEGEGEGPGAEKEEGSVYGMYFLSRL